MATSVRNKYVDELSTYYATGVGKLESFEVKKRSKKIFFIQFGASYIPPSAFWTWTLVSLRVKVEPTHFVPCFR